ncbi:TPA: hypothetical protein EYP66_20365 [Candidatus Poribacteria bacterium]|nr:hypothetical protein [Candidatus Poribacteria bacterium]
MSINIQDRKILRELAQQVAEIATLPIQQETIALWKALNALNPVRGMVMVDQIPWHEMDVDEELTLQTEDAFCRGIETQLRRTLYSWKHMRADMVVQPFVTIHKAIRGADFGVQVIEETAVSDARNAVVGHHYIDQFKTEEDIMKIRMPKIVHYEEATKQAEERAHEIFDGILEVRLQGALPGFAPWDRIVQWRGPENMILDLVDRPSFMHQIIGRLTEAHLCMLDQLEAKGLLGFGQSTIHCSGAFTDELPAAGFDPQRPRAKDLWTSGMAQIFSTVSPAMHQEFEIDYAARWYARFGLGYYGCCEPLDEKVDIIRNLPRVRKISMSPWVDVDKGAEQIGREFVFSRKPNPAFLAWDTWRPEVVEQHLRDTLEKCNRYGCPVEFILKDISTVRYQPQRLWEWVDIAMRVVKGE